VLESGGTHHDVRQLTLSSHRPAVGISHSEGNTCTFQFGHNIIFILKISFQIIFVLLYFSVVKVMKVKVSAKQNVFKSAINSYETGPEEVRAQTHLLN